MWRPSSSQSWSLRIDRARVRLARSLRSDRARANLGRYVAMHGFVSYRRFGRVRSLRHESMHSRLPFNAVSRRP
ncbi:hypothetical protein DY000_02008909 [Brassica cretica]|uniref:Uncharacterized protein n=1 Tax=Brassica cretica TaxID=69181 RepID=A0ABQ7CCN7_BRACR|nr:hypothetical protein DY000_02008909 [Brassica cretica]